MWFSSVRATKMSGDTLVLEVPNEFSELWLKSNYFGLLKDALAHAAGQEIKIEFQVSSNQPSQQQFERTVEPAPSIGDRRPSRNGNDRESAERASNLKDGSFNPKNTFETFVVGEANSHAHAAAKAIAADPGKNYNPLFLYGGVGLGKTHLLHAIGQHVVANKKSARVAYVSCEKFTNEYIDALQNNSIPKFRKKYRQSDVLLIDDIQFLAGKERIQEEFFHTFNALHESHKQIVLTCDRPASEIQNLEHRLMSRFEWGLVADVQPPDVETRLAILRKKAKGMAVELPDEILSFLANRIRTNIRRLEGALIRVVSYGSLTGKSISLEMVEGMLRELLHEEGKYTVTIDTIQKKVAEHYDIRLADMTSKRRPENIAFPRQVAMYLCRQLTGNSLNSIGEAFGGRDHGTVLHAWRLVKDRMEVDSHVRQAVSYLEKQLTR